MKRNELHLLRSCYKKGRDQEYFSATLRETPLQQSEEAISGGIFPSKENRDGFSSFLRNIRHRLNPPPLGILVEVSVYLADAGGFMAGNLHGNSLRCSDVFQHAD